MLYLAHCLFSDMNTSKKELLKEFKTQKLLVIFSECSMDYGCPDERKLPSLQIHFHSQIFRYSRSIFCLQHQPNFSDIFDLCLHWVSVVESPEQGPAPGSLDPLPFSCGLRHQGVQAMSTLTCLICTLRSDMKGTL